MRLALKILLLCCLVSVLAVVLIYQHYEDTLLAPMPLTETLEFNVPPGATLTTVANDLADKNLVISPTFLILYARLGEAANQLKTGSYELNPGMSVWDAVLRFNQGKVIQRTFTIIEGWRFKDLLTKLRQSNTVKWTLDGLSDEEIFGLLGGSGKNPEGMFFADTYHFPDGTTDRQFLKRAMQALDDYLAKAWPQRAEDLPLENAYQAVILASIIEKETAAPEERARIAGVFIRRLRIGMRLQTDPTVIYGMGDKFDGNIRRRDLRADTPYNTYTRKGLPPTPIALTNAKAIDAALHPVDDGALYFVASGNGRHTFSNNYKDHLKAVNLYQKRPRRKSPTKTSSGN